MFLNMIWQERIFDILCFLLFFVGAFQTKKKICFYQVENKRSKLPFFHFLLLNFAE